MTSKCAGCGAHLSTWEELGSRICDNCYFDEDARGYAMKRRDRGSWWQAFRKWWSQ